VGIFTNFRATLKPDHSPGPLDGKRMIWERSRKSHARQISCYNQKSDGAITGPAGRIIVSLFADGAPPSVR